MSSNELGELQKLVAGFVGHLERESRHGVMGFPAGALARPTQTALSASTTETLPVIRADLGDCTRCKLHSARTHIVFGAGNPTAQVMFIGEAPGRDEDEQGEPFVGRAGQLLTKMIEAMGLTRDEVYIANILKCRPPENRTPQPDEVASCEPFLRRQIHAIGPRIVILLGGVAAQALLRTKAGITTLRGRFHVYEGVPTMPTFHPAFLLRSPHMKRPVWEDLQMVMAEMDRMGLNRRRS